MMMKNASLTRRVCTLSALLLISAQAQVPGVYAQDVQTSAYRNSIEQEDIRRDTEKARQDLLLLIEDFQQNQLSSTELQETQAALSKLANVSDKEMQPLIELLREVSTTTDPKQIEAKLVAASQTQKNIHILLRKLADKLIIHRNQASMQQRMEQLIIRQLTNVRLTKEVAGGGRPHDKLKAEHAGMYTQAKNEQVALKSEVELAQDAIKQIVDGMGEGERPGFAEALKTAETLGVIATANRAAMDLSVGKWKESLESEGMLLDALQKMLASLRSKQTPAERVAAAKSKLEQLQQEQKRVAEIPANSTPAALKDQKETQRELADKVAALQKEVEAVNATAAAQLEKAQQAMEKADANLEKSKGAKSEEARQAEAAQKDATAKMEAAKAELDKQLGSLAKAEADARKQPLTADKHLENLQDLKKKVDDAAAQQKAQASAPNASAQQKLAEQTAQMQQQALPTNQQAAESLGQAATALQQPGKGEDAQKALDQASKQIEKQIDAAKQAQQLQALAGKISEAQKQAADAGKAIQETPKGPMDSAMKHTDEAQKAVEQAKAQTAPPATPPPAGAAPNPAGTPPTPPEAGSPNATAATPPPAPGAAPGKPEAGKPEAGKPAGGAPKGVDQALAKAQEALSKSNLEAAQKKQSGAASANKQAQEALAKAAESVGSALAEAMAQAGAPQAAQPGQPGQPGQPAQPGQPGQPAPGEMGESSEMTGEMGQYGEGGMTKSVGGKMASNGGKGGDAEVITGLKPKDREAATLLQKEKAPAEYSGMARQYMKNLAQGEANVAGDK